MMKARKIFDINKGHYIILEDNATQASTSVSQGTDMSDSSNPNSNKQPAQPANKSVETNPAIQSINNELNIEDKKYNDAKTSENNSYNKEKETQSALLNSAMSVVQDVSGEYDRVQTNEGVLTIRKKLATLELKHVENICRIELAHAQAVNRIENKRIEILSKISNESWNRFPEKYRTLNESNVHNAKIYLDVMVGDNCLITGMPDFKNAFKDSELVYGKDKKGYYALCVDREDFEKLYVVLANVGYKRDDVFSVVMSQVLDRTDMLSSGTKD